MEELFHVSARPGITRFEPRPPPPGNTTHTGRMVWAVGQRLLHNYLVPRDCPRVTFYTGPIESCKYKGIFYSLSCAYLKKPRIRSLS